MLFEPKADAALLAAAEQATGLKVSRPELTKAERNHRNAMLRNLDDAEARVGGSGVA